MISSIQQSCQKLRSIMITPSIPTISNRLTFTSIKARRIQNGNKAFTLIEVLVVMLIIAILLSLIIGIAAYAKRSAMEKKTAADIEKINMALQEYTLKYGVYPDSTPTKGNARYWTNAAVIGQFMQQGVFVSFIDPFGSDYVYRTPGDRLSYSLLSPGFDRVVGTGDDIETGR